jgi:adenylate cyclase
MPDRSSVTITDERRLVTVLFADLVGFTGRSEAIDPEEVRELQRGYFSTVTAEVERFGGTVEKYVGDAVMALFGAPQAHDDDAERALHAALAIREGVATLEGGLEVRIGVNTGEVVGGLGGPQMGDYTVSGDAVNVAARLQQTAGPNQILCGPMTRRLAYEAFAFATHETLSLKGRSEPVEAWRVEAALPERPRVRGGEARLFGRQRELATVESLVDEAREGRGSMLALVGEAGIGKSRLALEARARAEANGVATAWTTSRSYTTGVPYHLVGQLVPQLLQRTAGADTATALQAAGVTADETTLRSWARAIDDILGTASATSGAKPEDGTLSPAGKQRFLVQAIGALLRARSAARPLLVVLDDLHWADPASLAVIEELLGVVPELRLVLMATYRSNWSHGWEGRSAYEQLNLRPLRPDDARRMAVELATRAALPEDLTDRVLERAAGNPFFLEELLHVEGAAPDAQPHRLPASIHEMLLARLDALPAEARRVLQLASVVGMEFSAPIVRHLAEADAPATTEALRALQRAELVLARGSAGDDGMLMFRHPLIHEVAYGSLLTSARRAMHGRVARWIEEHGTDENVAELARHYDHSDDREKARRYLRLAGERAHALNATREAFDWYLAAADAWSPDPERRAEMLEAAAQELHLLGDIGRATEIQLDAVRLYHEAGNERAAATTRIWLGRYSWLLGEPEESQRQNALAIAGLEPDGPSPDLAMAYSFRSQFLMLLPDFAGGEEWARKAIEVAEATGAQAVLVHAYNNLGTCLMGRGDASGIDYLRRSRDLALELNLPDEAGRANTNLSNQGSRIFPLPYEEMDRHLVEGTAYSARTIPDGIFDRWIRSARGEFLLATARWSEAEELLFGLDADAAEAYLRCETLSLRAQLLAYRGRYDEAAEMTDGVADTARRVGDMQAVLPALTTQLQIRVGLEDDATAVALLREVIDRRGTTGELIISSWFLFEATDALTALHRRDAGSAALLAGLEALARFTAAFVDEAALGGDLVQVEVRHAMVGAAVDQLASLATAIGAFISFPTGRLPGRAAALPVLDREHRLFDAARVRLWLAEEHGSSDELAVATATFDELAAHPYLARAHRLRG